MTPEEMVAELRKLGYTVTEPITQENCRHPIDRQHGSVSVGPTGYKSDTTCFLCGKRWVYESPALPNQQQFWIHNGGFTGKGPAPDAAQAPVITEIKWPLK